jgi:hypothetical protein
MRTTSTSTVKSRLASWAKIKTGPKGHRPNGAHARAGELVLCRSTYEPVEEGQSTANVGEGRHRLRRTSYDLTYWSSGDGGRGLNEVLAFGINPTRPALISYSKRVVTNRTNPEMRGSVSGIDAKKDSQESR